MTQNQTIVPMVANATRKYISWEVYLKFIQVEKGKRKEGGNVVYNNYKLAGKWVNPIKEAVVKC